MWYGLPGYSGNRGQGPKASGKNLAAQIDSVAKGAILTHRGALILHQFRAIGNRAAHEVLAHSTEELRLAIDVIDACCSDLPAFFGPLQTSEMARSRLVVDSFCLNSAGVRFPNAE